MSLPTVTLGIPAYNAAPFLEHCLLSACHQTYPNFEIVVIDDGSTDNTIEIAQSVQNRFPHLPFRLLRNERNLGMAGNWNRILDTAQGDYVKILCADDSIHPDCIELQAQALQQDASLSLVTSPWELIGPRNRRLFIRTPLPTGRKILGDQAIRQCLSNLDNRIGQPSGTLFRLCDARACGYFSLDYTYYTDFEYWLRLLQRGHLYCCPKAVFSFRLHGISGTATKTRLILSRERQYLADLNIKYGLPPVDLSTPRWRGRFKLYDYARNLLFSIARFF